VDGQSYPVEVTTIITINGNPVTVQDEILVNVREITLSSAPQTWLGGYRNLADALPRVLPYANGCPDVTALFHLREAAQELMRKAQVWRFRFPMVTVAEQASYVLPLPAMSTLVKLIEYEYDGRPGAVVNDTQASAMALGSTHRDAIWTVDRTTIGMHPTPGETGKPFVVMAALAPAQDTNYIPAELYEHHINAIANGALGRVLCLPNQPWTNDALGMKHTGMFNDAMQSLGVQVARGFSRMPLRVRSYHF
jgi:hypothetical protein